MSQHALSVVLPFHNGAVRFQTAVSYHLQSVYGFDNLIGFGERFVRFALRVFVRRLGVPFCGLQIGVGDKVREHFVCDLDCAHGVFGSRFVNGGQSHNRCACPVQFRAHVLHDLHSFDAGHLFSRARINADNFRVRVRAANYFTEQHSRAIYVIRILCPA
jgi:hypothetical protein